MEEVVYINGKIVGYSYCGPAYKSCGDCVHFKGDSDSLAGRCVRPVHPIVFAARWLITGGKETRCVKITTCFQKACDHFTENKAKLTQRVK